MPPIAPPIAKQRGRPPMMRGRGSRVGVLLLLATSCHALMVTARRGIQPLIRHPHRAAVPFMAEDEAARRERLSQLFGADAANIAARTSSGKKKAPEEVVPEIQMLVKGMQLLDWGQIRLIDVDMAPGPLELSLSPLLAEGSSLLCVRLDMPLGMLLEEEDGDGPFAGAMRVAELLEDGAAKSGGLQVGDALRATTGVSMQMAYPTWQLMLGGGGQPKLQKILFPAQGQPFETVMAAIASNAREQQGNGQVILLIERPAAAGAGTASAAEPESESE